MTEGSREFRGVLETVSAGGVIIRPFIVWRYMDDKLGLEYI